MMFFYPYILTAVSLLLLPDLTVCQVAVGNGAAPPVLVNAGGPARPLPNPGRGRTPANAGNPIPAGKLGVGAPKPNTGRLGVASLPATGGKAPVNPPSLQAGSSSNVETDNAAPDKAVYREIAVKSVLDFETPYYSEGESHYAKKFSLLIYELDPRDPLNPPVGQQYVKEPRISVDLYTPAPDASDYFPDTERITSWAFNPSDFRQLQVLESDSIQVRPSDGHTVLDTPGTTFHRLGYVQMTNDEVKKMASSVFSETFFPPLTPADQAHPIAFSQRIAQNWGAPTVKLVRAMMDKVYPGGVSERVWLPLNLELQAAELAAKSLHKPFYYRPLQREISYDTNTKMWNGKDIDVQTEKPLAPWSEADLARMNSEMNGIASLHEFGDDGRLCV